MQYLSKFIMRVMKILDTQQYRDLISGQLPNSRTKIESNFGKKYIISNELYKILIKSAAQPIKASGNTSTIMNMDLNREHSQETDSKQLSSPGIKHIDSSIKNNNNSYSSHSQNSNTLLPLIPAAAADVVSTERDLDDTK